MSNSLKKRIVNALLVCGFTFMLCSVFFKLIRHTETCLPYSIMWAIFYSEGYFVAKTVHYPVNKDKRIIFYNPARIIFVLTIVIAFIVGVIFGLPNWKAILVNTCIPFGIALIACGE